jgi:N-acetylmuramic acid 6-phosphate etherase
MTKKPLTESDSNYDHLEKMSVGELLKNINKEDQKVALVVDKCIPKIEKLISQIVLRMQRGGRLFYIGAGTSGRLGIVDASECPPTFGVPHGMVVGIIAGGDGAIRKAVEFAEDDREQGWKDLQAYSVKEDDTIIGIAASGRTPYVIGTIEEARKMGCLTGCITCNAETELAKTSEYPIEVLVGPEFVTGSTRMKAGTVQKLVLNMISTAVMIQLGHVAGNKMVDMQLSNEKLVERGVQMVVHQLKVSESEARKMLTKHGSVRAVINAFNR